MDYLVQCSERMENAVSTFSESLKQVRTGRANPGLLEKIEVTYYGSLTPINQIASITVQEGTILVIKPYDRNSLKDIEVAINQSSLGLPTQNDGSLIRIAIPKLTEETRKTYCKEVNKRLEEARISLRNIRRDTNEAIKKDKELSDEDLKKDMLSEVDDIIKKFTKQAEDIAAKKEKEIMTL